MDHDDEGSVELEPTKVENDYIDWKMSCSSNVNK